jgi:sugar/nucleoside kinase (ribokinase family)
LADELLNTKRMAKAKVWDVIVVGELFFDEILSGLQALPRLGEEAFARKYCREVGGGAAITACGLSRLGAKVAVLGVLGWDGDWIRQRLSGAGVDTSWLEKYDAEPTGLTVSVSTREDRAFFSYYGANEELKPMLRRPDWIQFMSSAKIVHIATSPDHKLDRTLIPVLRNARTLVSLDVQNHLSWLTSPSNLKLLRAVDIFFPNEVEAEWVSGETGVHRILRGLRKKRLKRVVVKLGGKGAALAWDLHEFFVDPYPVLTEDTTGAGDCFNAGFLFGQLKGKDAETCLQWGNICGALSTRELGGLNGFPTFEQIQEALESEDI